MSEEKKFIYSWEKRETPIMDFSKAQKYLEDVKEILDKHSIPFFLFFGTLLGAYREHNFIYLDHDIDVAVLWEYAHLIPSLKDDFINKGYIFCLGCGVNGKYFDQYITKEEGKEKVDIYALASYKEYRVYARKYVRPNQETKYVLSPFPNKFFEKFDMINFLGKTYNIPNNVEELLEYQWGTWWIAAGGQIGWNKMKSILVPIEEFHEEIGI